MYKVNLFLKRTFDLFSTIAAIIFLLPVWILFPIIIKIDSKGPVFFKQERRGKNGKIFRMFKFRSMYDQSEFSGSGLFSYKDDPRVTRFGKFLRKTSLDEIPQLFNIFIGQMSVVGPRPCVKYELGDFETLNKKYKKRFQMKPGLTGWAQAKGRNFISWDEKVSLDNEYIDLFKKQGVFIDLKVIFISLFSVFKKENIYESKIHDEKSNEENAKLAEQEIIRLAHLDDEN